MAQIRPPERLTCSGCDNTWAGVTRAHCAACHRTYNAAGLFTAHRRDDAGIVPDDTPEWMTKLPTVIRYEKGRTGLRFTIDGEQVAA